MERNPREEQAVGEVAKLTFRDLDETQPEAQGSVEGLPEIDPQFFDANLDAQQYKIPTSADASNTSRFDPRYGDVTTPDAKSANSFRKGSHTVHGANYDTPKEKPASQFDTAPVLPRIDQSYSPTKGGETQVSFDSTGRMKVTKPGLLNRISGWFN